MLTKILVIFMLMVLYVVGGAAVKVLFDSHAATLFFGFLIGFTSCISAYIVVNCELRKEQSDD
jgi:preprotein translocase subunit SecF